MIVVCDKCQSRFKLDESRIKTRHFKARCSRCQHVFSATKPEHVPVAPEENVPAPGGPAESPPAPVAPEESSSAPLSTGIAAKVIAISNQKGGVAKMTTCLNLGISLALLRKKVLLIDFDVQSNLSISLGYSNKPSFYDMLNAPSHKPAESALIESQYTGLWLLPSNKNMVLLNKKYFGAGNFEFILKDRLIPILDQFDYILIDTPPSIEFFTLNALTTARNRPTTARIGGVRVRAPYDVRYPTEPRRAERPPVAGW